MAGAAADTSHAPPSYTNILGHPRPLWMLFMAEFWERFAFYGIRWALVLYIVAQFHGGDSAGQGSANLIYGSYLALVYAGAIFGGYVADRYIGYQRSILIGAVIMAVGLFMISVPNEEVFKLGLATIIVGNGLFKPIISTLVGKIYAVSDERRDSGFTIFYMGINLGAMLSPLLTDYLSRQLFGTTVMPAYKMVFIASGIGMLISLVWFYLGRDQLKGVGMAPPEANGAGRIAAVFIGAAVVIPAVYYMLSLGSLPLYQVLDLNVLSWGPGLAWLLGMQTLQIVLTVMFVALAVILLVEGIKNGAVARDMTIAMLIIFAFNILFWMFFEQAGSSFTFLAQNIVDRNIGGWEFPVAYFQSVNSLAIITLAPVLAWGWVKLAGWRPSGGLMAAVRLGLGLVCALLSMLAVFRLFQGILPDWLIYTLWGVLILLAVISISVDLRSVVASANPSIPRKFGLGLLFNGLAFLLLMYALTALLDANSMIPFWTLFMVYVIQSVGELCLSPIGLSMVTKLAPVKLVGFAMGGWFLSTGIGNNLSGIFASHVSGEGGMTTASALSGYTFGFWSLAGAGALLFLIAPLVQKLMHGVK